MSYRTAEQIKKDIVRRISSSGRSSFTESTSGTEGDAGSGGGGSTVRKRRRKSTPKRKASVNEDEEANKKRALIVEETPEEGTVSK